MTAELTDPRNFIDFKLWPRLETCRVSKPSSFLRSGPRTSSSAHTEILCGTLFHIHRKGRGWVWGQAECQLPGANLPGYIGWLRRSDLVKNTAPSTHKVSVLSAPVFSKANIKSRCDVHLPLNSTICAIPADEFLSWENKFLHKNHLAELSAPAKTADWVSIAESMIGRPYVWGGVSSQGLDCSGLVQTALRAFGSDAARDSDQQSCLGEPVKFTEDLLGLKRGDLVFWKGHVGVMTSPTRLLHANAHHMLVASEPLKTAVRRINKNAGSITAIRRL